MDINNNFTRDDIAENLHKEFGLTKKDCIIFVNDIIDVIIKGLVDDGYVKIHNYGTFKIRRKKSRIGRNPKTRVNVMIGERNVITFKASKSVKTLLNRNNES